VASPWTQPEFLQAEQKILQSIPEPEEGFRLIINPGYGLPQMRGVWAMPVALPTFRLTRSS
jgi:hypothetical protein